MKRTLLIMKKVIAVAFALFPLLVMVLAAVLTA
jgi:hypothetical protein